VKIALLFVWFNSGGFRQGWYDQFLTGTDTPTLPCTAAYLRQRGKKLKALLNLAALSAKRNDPEIKNYFERKVSEGKNKMLVLNAVRCKVISRAFAVIQRNSPFVNLNKFAKAS